mgnify:CR=1 FL=1
MYALFFDMMQPLFSGRDFFLGKALQLHIVRSVKSGGQYIILFIHIDISFAEMIVQVHCSFGISNCLINNDKIRLVNKKYGTPVFQPVIMRIFRYQDLFITFWFPKFSDRLRGL